MARAHSTAAPAAILVAKSSEARVRWQYSIASHQSPVLRTRLVINIKRNFWPVPAAIRKRASYLPLQTSARAKKLEASKQA